MAHEFGSAGTVVAGVEASSNPRAHILPESPRPNFYLMHSPQGWEPNKLEDGTWEWLPVLKRLLLKPGVNGVRMAGGTIDDSQARIGYQDRGWTIIDRRLGYVTRYPCRGGNSYYLTWDEPIKAGRRLVVRHDAEGYNDFRRSLVEDGVISPPVPEVLAAILQDYHKQIDRNSKDVHIPIVKAKIDSTKDLIKGATAAAAKVAPKPKPKRRRTRAKKAATDE